MRTIVSISEYGCSDIGAIIRQYVITLGQSYHRPGLGRFIKTVRRALECRPGERALSESSWNSTKIDFSCTRDTGREGF